MEDSYFFEAGLLLQISMRTGNWYISGVEPKKKCNTCYGRGYSAHNIVTDQYVPCRCIIKQLPVVFEYIKKLKLVQKEAQGINILKREEGVSNE